MVQFQEIAKQICVRFFNVIFLFSSLKCFWSCHFMKSIIFHLNQVPEDESIPVRIWKEKFWIMHCNVFVLFIVKIPCPFCHIQYLLYGSCGSCHVIVYLEPGQLSKREHFAKIVNSCDSSTIFAKRSILDVWQGSE